MQRASRFLVAGLVSAAICFGFLQILSSPAEAGNAPKIEQCNLANQRFTDHYQDFKDCKNAGAECTPEHQQAWNSCIIRNAACGSTQGTIDCAYYLGVATPD